ncbi:recombination protein A [Lacticaseibacillus paracasei subsp. tolerans DSM 20258]|nr:recombination protein A [Lacticaseibacillus paracasei subsp. tolerans DSM 20258]
MVWLSYCDQGAYTQAFAPVSAFKETSMAKKTTAKNDNTKSDATDRDTELEKALQKIKKAFGEGAVMKMGDRPELKVDVVSTGILSLDLALGVGGLPRGRIVEVYGPESTGKTTIALQTIAELQKSGGKAAYIDAENAMDPKYAAELGVNIDDLLLSQPNSGEQGLEIAEMLIESAAVDIVVIDSVAALVPKAEIEGAIGDSHVGLQARLMSQALRKMAGSINNTNTLVIFINQLREKVGVMFGNPEVTPGGRALKFYASVRIEVKRGQQVKDGKDVVGFASKLKVTKNKVAPPFKSVETTMSFGHGIEHNTDMINLATDKDNDIDVITKSGSWYNYGKERLGQGLVNASHYLDEHPEISKEIQEKIREQVAPKKPEETDKQQDDKEDDQASGDKKTEKTTTTDTEKKADKKDDPASFGVDRLV